MNNQEEIEKLEKRIAELKEEQQKEIKESICEISAKMNIYHLIEDEQYNSEMGIITNSLEDYKTIEHIMEDGYLKVSEYLNIINDLETPLLNKIQNKINEVKASLKKRTEYIRKQEMDIRNNIDAFIYEDEYKLLDDLKHDLCLLKNLLK